MYRKDIVPKSPSDRFAVREATMDDIQALTQLWYDSYNNSNTFWEVMTPDDPITRRWWDGVWAMGIEAGPTKIATAVVEDLENDKRLVAMGRLNVAQADGSQADYFMPEYPTTWDPQLTENFWGAMAKARKEIMGNRPHWSGFAGVHPSCEKNHLAYMFMDWLCRQADASGLEICCDSTDLGRRIWNKHFGFQDRKEIIIKYRSEGSGGDGEREFRMTVGVRLPQPVPTSNVA